MSSIFRARAASSTSRWVIRTSALIAALLVATPAFAQQKGEDESAALVEEGRADLRHGALGDAGKALDQAIALNPRRVDAYVLRSAVYAAQKRYKDGIALMRRAQALAPADEEVLTALGSQLVLAGAPDEGVPLLQQVVAKDPARYDAQLLLGLHWHDAGRWSDSIAALEQYFAHRPAELAAEDSQHRIDLADAYLRARQPEKALGLFEQAAADRKQDLRARVGVAWATAAIDCKKARPLLRDLEVVADAHPEVYLVDGQCALALGDPNAALERGRRYLERAPHAAAAGHALVGEANAARGNLPLAARELGLARELEPKRRRWPVRLAIVLRRGGDPAGALAALEQLGPPAAPNLDPDWWDEIGEALLAKGDAAGVIARLGPVIPELPGDANARTVLGAAQLQTNAPADALKTLDDAEQIHSQPRSRVLLSAALATVAAQKLVEKDAAGAEPLLARADQLDGTPIVWRDLGIARLALDKFADAIAPLDRAAAAGAPPIVLMLDARAHALSGDVVGARPIYDRALAAEKDADTAAEIALDWAATEVASGDPALAVSALEKPNVKPGPLALRVKSALAVARHAAGVAAIHAGNGTKAVELLRASASTDPSLATKCDLALATVVAGDTGAALAALKAISGQSCPFPPPADVQAAPILSAFTDGLNPRRAGKALDRLEALGGKSTGPALLLLNTSVRVVALEAAADAYRNGALAQARKYLGQARAANARLGNDEVAHNIAVLDLADGRVDAAIPELERVAPKLPEALVNLGLAYEKKGEPQKALDAWRRARKAGVRFPPLAEWIESKERIYGASGGAEATP
ncbi:MAG TPA: tetratricopeptide repeat protein [Kofleriaceae bacterium]|jgi:tetratricopeptide (TPR) repeat protein